jgi:hypothetical protein
MTYETNGGYSSSRSLVVCDVMIAGNDPVVLMFLVTNHGGCNERFTLDCVVSSQHNQGR